MRKIFLLLLLVVAVSASLFYFNFHVTGVNEVAEVEDETEGYDGPMERGMLEYLKTKDPATNVVPQDRLFTAMVETEGIKQQMFASRTTANLVWQERGPVYDSVGPSNGNGRGASSSQPQLPGVYTSGRIRAVLVDAADPTGNTVWIGGVAGGLWRTSTFLNATPEWQAVNDFFDNMAITSIAQDPSNSNNLYFCTGEATSNADAVYGKGVWKSSDHGVTWVQLNSTSVFNRNFKILCDISGNVYLATRGFGLQRSTNGGATWTSIAPAGISATNSTFCTDIEFASQGRLIASFGYTTTGGTIAVRYTDAPASATSSVGWETPTGIATSAGRIELTARGDTAYAAPTNSSNNIVEIYKSFDGGASWTRSNVADYTANIANTQGWYDLAFEISPVNGLEFMIGGIEAFRSINGGTTLTKSTSWVSTPPYVHADHHTYKWMLVGSELRLIMATDGGVFLSTNNGVTYADRNRSLGIKQFYSGAIHPTKENYFIAGAQDNGSHQIKNAGKTYSIEVTGGDGGIVAIDQRNPNFQFTSTTNNNYRRSSNDGASWTSFSFSSSRGFFINPYVIDDSVKIMYASFALSTAPNKSILRWNNLTTATSVSNSLRDTLVIGSLTRGATASNASSFLVSPYTPNRLYVGGSNGSLVRIDDAKTVTNADIDSKTTVLTGSQFSTGYITAIAMGSTENYLLAVFSNYGVNNLWYSADGGINWSAIDGNLPDMPVRSALFDPSDNNKLIIGTETGVWTTDAVDGTATKWLPSTSFPNVRTEMLSLRKSDNLILAATHGRGLWTTNLPTVLAAKDVVLKGKLAADGTASLVWTSDGETNATRFKVEYSNTGSSFNDIGDVDYRTKTFAHKPTAPIGYYRIRAEELNHSPIFSNIIYLKATAFLRPLQVKVLPNPIGASGKFEVSIPTSGNFNWYVVDTRGSVIMQGKGNGNASAVNTLPLNASGLAKGVYRLRVVQGTEAVTQSFIKQ